MTIRRRPPAMVEGLRNARRSLGDGSVLGRTRIATPPKPQPRPQPVTVIPAAQGGNAATITLVTSEPQDLTEDGPVEFHSTAATRRSFATPVLPAPAPPLPFGGVYSMQVDLPLVTPVPAGTRFSVVNAAGEDLWRGDPDQWEIGWGRLIGDVDWVSLHVPGQDWPATITPIVRVEVPDGGTVTIGAGARATWKMEGTPAAAARDVPSNIPPDRLLFDGDADRQGGGLTNQVLDWSGNERDSGGGMSLTWVDDVLDGHAIWRDGHGGFVSGTTGNVPLSGAARSQLWVIVAKASTTSGSATLIGRPGANATGRHHMEVRRVNETQALGSGGDVEQSGDVVDTGWHIWAARTVHGTSATWATWLDGTKTMDFIKNVNLGHDRKLMARAVFGSAEHWAGDVARILAYQPQASFAADEDYYLNSIRPALLAQYPSLPS